MSFRDVSIVASSLCACARSYRTTASARLARGEDVDAALYTMRTHPRFETGDPRYAWLNHTTLRGDRHAPREPGACEGIKVL
jgi:hypothetical protein